jgi:hypothetical protein
MSRYRYDKTRVPVRQLESVILESGLVGAAAVAGPSSIDLSVEQLGRTTESHYVQPTTNVVLEVD